MGPTSWISGLMVECIYFIRICKQKRKNTVVEEKAKEEEENVMRNDILVVVLNYDEKN